MLNHRVMTLVDLEHMTCKDIAKKQMLPAKRMSTRCLPWSPHTHPIKGLLLPLCVLEVARSIETVLDNTTESAVFPLLSLDG